MVRATALVLLLSACQQQPSSDPFRAMIDQEQQNQISALNNELLEQKRQVAAERQTFNANVRIDNERMNGTAEVLAKLDNRLGKIDGQRDMQSSEGRFIPIPERTVPEK